MEDNNVIRMDEHKNKNKVHKISFKKILLGFIVCIALSILVIAGTCKTKKVGYYLKCKFVTPKILPFVDTIYVSINAPDSITIHVKEKKRAGCLQYNGKYVYFDKNGYALESHEKKYDNVPLVTGLKYNELQMQKKIDVKDEKVFSYLLELTTAISKYHLPIDQIHIKDDGNALLISGDITVDLYDKNDIDIKIPELKGMLKKVKGKSGTIDMRYFSEDRKIAIFQPKNS